MPDENRRVPTPDNARAGENGRALDARAPLGANKRTSLNDHARTPLRADARALVRLSLPLVASQLGMMAMGVVDTLFVGHIGTRALAAAALGNLWMYGTILVAMGIVMGLDPIISQAHGAGEPAAVARAFQRGLVLCALLSVPLAILWLATAPVLRACGQEPALAADAARFVRVQTPTALAFLVFIVTRQYLIGRGITAPAVWTVLGANVLNVALNWVLVFGKLGVPAMGLVGSGLATAITRAVLALALLALTFGARLHADAWVPWSKAVLDARALGVILKLGLPLGVQFGLEAWAFQVATLLAGKLGTDALAAHTIVLNLASLSFMVPLGLSIGTSVRVGQLLGAGERARARTNGLLGLGLGASVMMVSALLFALFRRELPLLYGASAGVALMAAGIFPIAAAFQLFDGTQVVGGAILRGLGRPHPAAVLNLVGYYVFALPAAWWLGFARGGGLAGLWWGLALGLAIVAFGLVALVMRRSVFDNATRAG